MTKEQAAAYVFAQASCVYARVAGMAAENLALIHANQPPKYREADFAAVPEELGVHHNAVMTLYQEVNRY